MIERKKGRGRERKEEKYKEKGIECLHRGQLSEVEKEREMVYVKEKKKRQIEQIVTETQKNII